MKQRTTKRTVFVTLALAFGLLLAACATPTPEVQIVRETQVVRETVQVEVTREVQVEVEVPVQVTPAPGVPQEITIDVGPGFIANLDPEQWNTTLEKNILQLTVFEPLVRRASNMDLAPALAESWDVGADGRTWTFHLREGVTFHDGTPFNAEAAKWNLDRIRNPDSPSIVRFTFLGAIEDVRAVDEHTLEIVTRGTYAVLPQILSGWGGAIASPSAVEALGEDFNLQAVGTGPFKVDSFAPGEELILARNDDYWGPTPNLTRVRMISVREDASRSAALKTGETDVLVNVPVSQMPFLRQDADIQIIENPNVFYSFIGFNTSKEPTNDPELRRAIVQAIDMQALTEALYGTEWQNYCGPVTGPLMFGYNPDLDCIGYDPDAARQRIQELGYDGLEMSYVYWETPLNRRMAEILQAFLADVGIDLVPEGMEYGASVGRIVSGQGTMYITGYGNSTGDPIPSLWGMLHSSSIGGVNWVFYSNPEFDGVLEQAAQELDENARLDLVQEAVRIVTQDASHLVIGSPINVLALSKRITGWQTHPMGDYLLDRVTVLE